MAIYTRWNVHRDQLYSTFAWSRRGGDPPLGRGPPTPLPPPSIQFFLRQGTPYPPPSPSVAGL